MNWPARASTSSATISMWRSNVPTYSKVKCEAIYSANDLVYYCNQRQLEYDFVVAPGADPTRIRLKFQSMENSEWIRMVTYCWQPKVKRCGFRSRRSCRRSAVLRKAVEGRYWMAGANTISFRVADYDLSKPLTIDPILTYSTYLGGRW